MAKKAWETGSKATATKPSRQETGIGKAKVLASVAAATVPKRDAAYAKLPKAANVRNPPKGDMAEGGKSASAMRKMDAKYIKGMESQSAKEYATNKSRAASQNKIKDK